MKPPTGGFLLPITSQKKASRFNLYQHYRYQRAFFKGNFMETLLKLGSFGLSKSAHGIYSFTQVIRVAFTSYLSALIDVACQTSPLIDKLNNKLHRKSDSVAYLEQLQQFEVDLEFFHEAMRKEGDDPSSREYLDDLRRGVSDYSHDQDCFFENCDRARARSAAITVKYLKNKIFS